MASKNRNFQAKLLKQLSDQNPQTPVKPAVKGETINPTDKEDIDKCPECPMWDCDSCLTFSHPLDRKETAAREAAEKEQRAARVAEEEGTRVAVEWKRAAELAEWYAAEKKGTAEREAEEHTQGVH